MSLEWLKHNIVGLFIGFAVLFIGIFIGVAVLYVVFVVDDNFNTYKPLAARIERVTSGWLGKLAGVAYGGSLLGFLGSGGAVLRSLWSALWSALRC